MSWRDAFFRQARSDDAVRRRLNDPAVEYAHRLHYLQMVAEKLAKGHASGPRDAEPPPATHSAFARFLQTCKGRPELRRVLGMEDAAQFRAFINSLLPLARQIEALAPSAAGFGNPNPEYPWRDPMSGQVHAPADYAFDIFDPRDPRMIKLERLIEALVRVSQ